MPRFVLLRHETPPDYPRGSHWDLMFEQQGALRTWALQELPVPGNAIVAERLADHRLAYLEFEGAISGNRGEVRRDDAGAYVLEEDLPDRFVVLMRGQQLQGRLKLLLIADARWRIQFESAVTA